MLAVISNLVLLTFFSNLSQRVITSLLSHFTLEVIVLVVLTIVATWLSYNSKYAKCRKLFSRLNSKLSEIFWKLILLKSVFAIIFYSVIIFTFQKLGNLEELNWIRLYFTVDFGLFIGSLVSQDEASSNNNLEEANQILGGFDLFTFSFVANVLNRIFVLFNQLQNAITEDIDKKIAGEEDKLSNKINEILSQYQLATIENYIEQRLKRLKKYQTIKVYRTEFRDIKNLPLSSNSEKQEKKNRLFDLMIEVFDADTIKDLTTNPSSSFIVTEIRNLDQNQQQNSN